MANATKPSSRWVVHKFGGTSLADADHYIRVAEILGERSESHQAVVVSAMAGITDRLLHLVDLASQNLPYRDALTALGQTQRRAMESLGTADALVQLEADISDIGDILHSTDLIGHAGALVRDRISGYGELWSARQLADLLLSRGVNARFVDAREFIVTSNGEMGPSVDWGESEKRLSRLLGGAGGASRDDDRTHADPDTPAEAICLLITGYVASDAEGHATTLGRNGSDHSASIVGRLLRAQAINIWTDVDGVMSADPRLVPNAQVLASLSFDEALELAYFGAGVLHPQTMMPAIQAQIPVFIRNTFNPSGGATRIGHPVDDGFQIKGISATGDLALVNLEGAGMIGVPGTARRVFGAIKRVGISVVMISQANSEHSICFVVRQTDADGARRALQEEFARELDDGMVQSIAVSADCSILAVVGDAMVGQVGVAARLFTALADARISVRAIAQGSSERNISAVIDSALAQRAVRAVHAAFYLSPQTLSIGLVGAGKVGTAFLSQLSQERERLKTVSNIDLRIRAVSNSRRMLLSEQSIDPAAWAERLERDGQPADMDSLQKHVQADHLPHAVLLDCTASDAVAQLHPQWLAAGIHVMTANKKANAGDLDHYRQIRAAAKEGNARYLYETTVGAGLPVIKVLEDLQRTGDRIHSVEGVFSGTLAYLFNRFDGSVPFSRLVREAWELGYTEPDPREDLSGMDVARKLVILGREMGLDLSVSDLHLTGLVPPGLEELEVEPFLQRLTEFDGPMHQRMETARGNGCVLRFTGRLEGDGGAVVGLAELPSSHAFAHTNLTDNVIQFKTDRYCENPLVIQGPGAGPEVTAAGVFADLLRLCGDLGAHV